MLATVMALYNAAGLITPLLYGRRTEEMLLWRKLTILLMAAALIVTMASPAMAFNSSQHCTELAPERPCPYPTEGPPTLSGGPEASHRQGTRGNENVQPNPSSVVVHCRGVEPQGEGVVAIHFNENAPQTTGGGTCV